MKYNIYCDESCHLENDHQKIMVLGAVKCGLYSKKKTVNDIRNLKKKYNMNIFCEVKWTKVSLSKLNFYKELVNYFFDNDNLMFRAVFIDKTKINHKLYNQTHDEFYYKVYYQLLSRAVIPNNENYIYLDIKDTKGSKKVKKLSECLSNGLFDFNMDYIKNVQNINSKESEILQIADILIGAISYVNRKEYLKDNYSKSKMELINLIISRSGYSLTKSTFLSEEKFNLFFMVLQ
ncbi:MAG: DUF3800 domain-containing protein [Bacilli bacterium]